MKWIGKVDESRTNFFLVEMSTHVFVCSLVGGLPLVSKSNINIQGSNSR